MVSNVTTGMQDESELLLCILDDDFFFGAQYDSDASPAVASPAGESYESEESLTDGDAPVSLCVDPGVSLVHIRALEQCSKKWSSVTQTMSPDRKKKAASLAKMSSRPHS